jgi:hypothetical protein
MKAGGTYTDPTGTKYKVLDPKGFCGLPTAEIAEGPNQGIRVILPVPVQAHI